MSRQEVPEAYFGFVNEGDVLAFFGQRYRVVRVTFERVRAWTFWRRKGRTTLDVRMILEVEPT